MLKKIIPRSLNKESLSEGEFLGSFTKIADMPGENREVCFMGRSNSGKSTLLSALMKNSSIVKISGSPGSTKTINFFLLNRLYLVDLPGYGYAKTGHAGRDELSRLIGDYLLNRQNIAGAFLLLDCHRDLKESELYILKLMKNRNIPIILILTKIDRLNQKETSALKKRIATEFESLFFQVFAVSGKKRENTEALLNFIRSLGG